MSVKRDRSSGKFKKFEKGEKTPKMLEVEKDLGQTIQEDYNDFYIKQGKGQKALAKRWGVTRLQIFGNAKRQGWIDILGLKKREGSTTIKRAKKECCAICKAHDVTIQSAHWIENSKHGPAYAWNLIGLCPNCHDKLDKQKEKEITESCRKLIIHKIGEYFFAKKLQVIDVDSYFEIVSEAMKARMA
jgi:5-methylcytosine-specific restriction endonuclease McrA